MIEPYYQDDACTIYHGDCREILPTLGRFDLLLTDPPYGISHKTHGHLFRNAKPIENDASTAAAEWCREWARSNSVPLCMFFSPYVPLANWRSVLVWSKGEHVGIGGDRKTCWKRDFEMIGVERNGPLLGKRDSAVLRFNAVSPPPTGHFCEKPIALMKYLVGKFDAQTILDPFMGSGTTLVAAKLEGRKAVGIEINEKYCESAAKRLEQGVLF